MIPTWGATKGGATLALDFVNAQNLPASVTFSRGTAATQYDSNGALIWSPMNAIRNNTMVGAVAGTPGTLPTNWSVSGPAAAGLTQTVVGSGTSQGISYIDVRFQGTPAAGNLNLIFDVPAVSASAGQSWAESAYIAVVGGSTANVSSPLLRFDEGAPAYVRTQTATTIAALNSSLVRYSGAAVIGATTTQINSVYLQVTCAAAAIDITLRIGMPQLELGSAANTVNATSGTAYYGPRFDYDPTTLLPNGLLIEEQRTNSIRNNTMQGAVAGTPGTAPTNWTVALNGITGVTTSIVGTGVQNGIAYIDIRANGTPSATIAQGVQISFEPGTTIAASASQVWTQSAWVSVVAGSTANISGFVHNVQQYNAGAFVQSNSVSFTPTATLSRYAGTVTFSASTTTAALPLIGIGVTASAAIDITLRIGLPQLELGAFATSVIPTYGAAATRNADTASMTGTNFSSWYNATQGTLYSESVRLNVSPASTYPVTFSVSTDINNRMELYSTNIAGNQQYRAYGNVAAVAQFDIGSRNIALGTVAKQALAYQVNDFSLSVNGFTPDTDTVGTLPTVNQASIGSGIGVNFTNGWVRAIRYYPTRLPNATLQGLTV